MLPAVLPSAALPDMLWLSPADVISVPLEIHAHRPFVQVVLNGHPADLLFDTSVQETSVDVDALRDADQGAAQGLQIGAVRFLHVPAVRNGISAYAKTFLGTPAAGVLGADILARFPVALDGKAGSLRIFRNNLAEAAARPAQAMIVPLNIAGGFPAVAVTMDDIAAGSFGLDTGASSDFEMRMSSATARHVSLVGAVPEVREARWGASIAGHTMRAASAQLGDVRLIGPIVALPDERQHWFPPGVDGMLGGRLLERMDLWIDLPARTLGLVPRADEAGTVSVYDTSGAWIVAKNHGVYVHAVVPDSPADASGLSVGDEVLKINTEFVIDLERARELFKQPTGTRVHVMYRRSGSLRTATLILRDPL